MDPVSSKESPTGIETLASQHSVDETVNRLKHLVESKGLKMFATVDHSGEAKAVGLEMPNTKLLIFGSPKGGTPLMIAAPTIALDLPLKILIREDADSRVWVSYNSAGYLSQRHNLPSGMEQVLAGAGKIAEEIAGESKID